jgi:methyl-accepting chemotaxis protein
MNAKTLDARAELAGRPAMAQAPSTDLSAADLTIEDFAALIGDVTGQLDLLDATIESARAAKVEREFAMIAAEVRILTAQVRQAADGIAAAVTASGRISPEVATALAGIKEAIQHINDLIANAAAAEVTNRVSSQVVPLPSLRN